METNLSKLIIKKSALYFLLVTILLAGGSCAKKITFLNSSVAPAARGTVEVKQDKNKNYAIKVHLSNLAEVGRLNPPRQTYVVWLVTDGVMTKNIGQLKSGDGAFSKLLKASLETVTAFKPTKIFITAEDDAAVQYPSPMIVLTTDNF
jgi:hypothetical protein